MKKILLTLLCITLLSSCDKEAKSSSNSSYLVIDTYKDKTEPWLALRDSSSTCANLIGKLPDDTKVKIINELINNDFVEVEIKMKGYVNKNYLYKRTEITNNPKRILENYTSEIIHSIRRGGLSKIKRFIKQDSVKLFYWQLPKCSLNNNSFRNLKTKIQTDEYSFTQYKGGKLLSKLKNNKVLKPTYMQKAYFPAAGFGGGSVLPPSKESHVVVVPLHKGEHSDKLWLEYTIKNNEISLTQIGDWQWTP